MRQKNGAVTQLIYEMRQALDDLEKIRAMISNLKDLEKDTLLLRAARDASFVAIQSAIDLGNRIISLEGYRKPETYRDIFKVLEELGEVPPDLGHQLQDLSGFRNALVHFYWKFQRERLVKFIIEDFKALEKFLKEMVK
jgi:uncharacterized protein YutE (UPF0331/DUF86 family)